MVDLAKSGAPVLYTYLPPSSCQLPALVAGENLAAGDACYIKSDGTVWRSIGTLANAAAKVRGFATIDVLATATVTLFNKVIMVYGAGLTPGADYYLSGVTAGALATTASTGGTTPIAYAVDTTNVAVLSSTY